MIKSDDLQFRILTLMGLLFLGFLLQANLAYGSTEITDKSDRGSLQLELDQQSTNTSGTITRSRTGGPPVTSAPAPAPATENSNSSGGSSESRNVSRPVSGFPGGGSVSQAACTISQLFRGTEDFCPSPHPAAPAAPAGPVPAPQTAVVSEPVSITITTSDLLELIPSSPQILMDRGPFGLKNAHTNFYASHHEEQTITQTMFDQEVTITATPVEYRWDYGDGDTLVTELPGYPVDIFNTETDTSHQFTEPGVYTVELTTVFQGTFQVDGGEVQEVSAPVTQQADPIEIRIYSAVTRNVDQTCLENPDAWGCDAPD